MADLMFNYTNWRGVTSIRTVRPRHLWYGSAEYHPTGWFLRAWDVDKGAERDFYVRDIRFDYVQAANEAEAS